VNRDEVSTIARRQTAAMVMAYDEALHTLLAELTGLVPQHQRESYRLVAQRFTVVVLARAAGWSRP
jgi:hypothetical protein